MEEDRVKRTGWYELMEGLMRKRSVRMRMGIVMMTATAWGLAGRTVRWPDRLGRCPWS